MPDLLTKSVLTVIETEAEFGNAVTFEFLQKTFKSLTENELRHALDLLSRRKEIHMVDLDTWELRLGALRVYQRPEDM